MENPLISCIIPVYNGEPYLHEALSSIANQSFSEFEVILIDDCSTDNSFEVAKKFAENDLRFKVFQNEKNLGLPTTLNLAIERSRGQYIARMDADDIALPNRFLKQSKYLEQHSEIAIVGSRWQYFPNSGIIPDVPISSGEIKAYTLINNPLGHPTIMFRKSMLKKTGLYNPLEFPTEDYEMWCRCLDVVKAHNIEEVLLNYRLHSFQTSSKSAQRQKEKTFEIQVLQVNKVLRNLKQSEALLTWVQAPNRRELNIPHSTILKFLILNLISSTYDFNFVIRRFLRLY